MKLSPSKMDAIVSGNYNEKGIKHALMRFYGNMGHCIPFQITKDGIQCWKQDLEKIQVAVVYYKDGSM